MMANSSSAAARRRSSGSRSGSSSIRTARNRSTLLFKVSVAWLAVSVVWDACPSHRRKEGGRHPFLLGCAAQSPTTASPAAPAPSPTDRPNSASNSSSAASDAPSDVPTGVPSEIRTTSRPSARPSDSPSPSSAPTSGSTTARPSTISPTDTPSDTPTRTPQAEPTSRPTPGGGTTQKATLSDVVALYENVDTVSNTTIIRMLADTEVWFMSSFNNQTYSGRRRRRTLSSLLRSGTTTGASDVVGADHGGWSWPSSGSLLRRLQGSGSATATDPADSGVRNMRTQIRLVSRRVTNSGLRLVYNQDLQWTETAGDERAQPLTASELAALPYQYRPTNDIYVDILKKIQGFENVESPFQVPVFPVDPTPAPTAAPTQSKSSGSSSPLPLGAIIGIAVGGAVFLALLLYCVYYTCCRDGGFGGSSGGYDKDSRMASSSGGGGAGAAYGSGGYSSSTPPSRVVTGRDEVSTIDYPRDGVESMGDFQDQSVATVDYDYSKAYGGAGDTSVVSSAGGTMGDTTRQSAGDVAAVAAARAALGASFDSDGGNGRGGAAGGAAAGGGAYREDGNVKEEIIEIDAPAGKLGVVIDTPDDGAPVVHAVKDSSVIADQICVGDKLIAVDDEDVRSMTAIKVSKLISKKSANPSRKLTIVRTTYIDDA